jgi:hypothetical protein
MGQYYKAIILSQKTEAAEVIRAWLDAYGYNSGAKLIEHAYIDSPFVGAVERLLSPDGMLHMSRLVWAGDYADGEPETGNNLYMSTMDDKLYTGTTCTPTEYPYIVNHTKRQYVDKTGAYFHPLPLLTAEGNGRGGGDYYGPGEPLVGSWARDLISLERVLPLQYKELVCKFGSVDENKDVY